MACITHVKKALAQGQDKIKEHFKELAVLIFRLKHPKRTSTECEEQKNKHSNELEHGQETWNTSRCTFFDILSLVFSLLDR